MSTIGAAWAHRSSGNLLADRVRTLFSRSGGPLIEVPVPASAERTLAECLRQGLEVRSERELAGRPGSCHYHLAFPGKPGTLELSEWHGEVWFSVNERRDCGWVSDFARTTAAALGRAETPDPR